MKCSSVFILGALVGVSIAAPIPATHEGAKIARRQNPLTEIVGLASGVLPVDMKNSGIDKLVGTLNDDGEFQFQSPPIFLCL